MRESALVARRDERGREVLVVHKPVTFTLDETARAMHAIVDSHMNRLDARNRVGRSRVREVLRSIALDGSVLAKVAGQGAGVCRRGLPRRWLECS